MDKSNRNNKKNARVSKRGLRLSASNITETSTSQLNIPQRKKKEKKVMQVTCTTKKKKGF